MGGSAFPSRWNLLLSDYSCCLSRSALPEKKIKKKEEPAINQNSQDRFSDRRQVEVINKKNSGDLRPLFFKCSGGNSR